MSNFDKRRYAEQVVGTAEARETVRIFAFTNRRPRYEVVFSPEAPLIVLKTKAPSPPQHPCLQWVPFSNVVHEAQPNTTHALYVVDTSCLQGPGFNIQQEETANTSIGPVMRKLRNAMCKLNPHNGLLIAAGTSAFTGLKYTLVGEKTMGHRDRLIKVVVLVCPGPEPTLVMQRLTTLLSQQQNLERYPKPEIRVLVKTPIEAISWTTWLEKVKHEEKVIDAFRVSIFEDRAGKTATGSNPKSPQESQRQDFASASLFHAIAELCDVTPDGTQPDEVLRFPTAQLFRLDIFLSKETKNVVQIPKRSPLNTLGYDEEEEELLHEEERLEEDDEGECAAAHDEGRAAGPPHGDGHDKCDNSDPSEDEEEVDGYGWQSEGIKDLPYLKAPMKVLLEGRVMENGLLSTTEGVVEVVGLKELAESDAVLRSSLQRLNNSTLKKKNASNKFGSVSVRVETEIERDNEGRTLFRGLTIEKLTKREEEHSMTVPPASQPPPPYAVSSVRHRSGALVIRGRKCALVRCTEASPSVRTTTRPSSTPLGCFFAFPSLPVSEPEEHWLDVALRAACEACDCSSDNFYVPHFIPPSVMYQKVQNPASEEVEVVHMHVLVTAAGPPRGPASDALDDDFSPSHTFEWLSFQEALSSLATHEEQALLRELQLHVQQAFEAGLYHPAMGCAVFGESIPHSACVVLPPSGEPVNPHSIPCSSTASPQPALSANESCLRGIAASTTVPVSGAAESHTLHGKMVLAVVCPTREDREELLPAMRTALLTRRALLLGCSAEASDSPDEEAEEEAVKALLYSAEALAKTIRRDFDGPAALIVLGEALSAAEIMDFYDGPLRALSEVYQAKVSLYATLGLQSGLRLLSTKRLTTSHQDPASTVPSLYPHSRASALEVEMLEQQVADLDRLLEVLRFSDAVLLSEPVPASLVTCASSKGGPQPPLDAADRSTFGLLQLCSAASPGVSLMHHFQNPLRIPAELVRKMAEAAQVQIGQEGLLVVEACEQLLGPHALRTSGTGEADGSAASSGVPLTKGQWDTLERPGVLASFFQPGKWRLVHVAGRATATDSAVLGLKAAFQLSLDAPSRCLVSSAEDLIDTAEGPAPRVTGKLQNICLERLELHLWCSGASGPEPLREELLALMQQVFVSSTTATSSP